MEAASDVERVREFLDVNNRPSIHANTAQYASLLRPTGLTPIQTRGRRAEV
jgi:hypothetical protein